MPTTLVITNDFPPTIGGIEAFVAQICELLGDVVVLTRRHPGARTADGTLPFPVHRHGRLLLPDRGTRRAAEALMIRHGATRIIFGAAAPLGLLAPALRRAGATHLLAITHGHETWWARLPVSRAMLRRIGDNVDALSYISGFTRAAIAPALSPEARSAMVRLAPPVDITRFRPAGTGGAARPTVVAAGRFIRQKGFDTLLEAWDLVLAAWPVERRSPELVLIGDGPLRQRLMAKAARLTQSDCVRFAGPVPHRLMPALLAEGHVFALPVRTRFRGLNPEGLGMVFAEAAAAGLAVIAGDSGGTGDTLVPGASGLLVQPDDPAGLAAVLLELLTDLPRARAMGEVGRAHVATSFSPTTTAAVLRQVLDLG
ncbi:glycosyltransferase family 4 protein [Granulicoccus sp. GXG6511]|uniref:glycosyltransferase family 4 protein n=1 Tax=Granulicoccus sp. GXG6511 TaxID=3381351 RepID=UPI003D7D3EAB